jgi:hypothetical protein
VNVPRVVQSVVLLIIVAVTFQWHNLVQLARIHADKSAIAIAVRTHRLTQNQAMASATGEMKEKTNNRGIING